MALMRCMLTWLIPEDEVIWLDIDTLVLKPLTTLQFYDMSNYYIACAIEPNKPREELDQSYWDSIGENGHYCNTGVLLMNLKKLREDRKDLELVAVLNEVKLKYPDQDALNLCCAGHILYLAPTFNSCIYTKAVEDPDIIHFTPLKGWDMRNPNYQFWSEYARGGLLMNLGQIKGVRSAE